MSRSRSRSRGRKGPMVSTEPDAETCLICYETEGGHPLECCGKVVCPGCLRALRRQVLLRSPLCPFCRCPSQGVYFKLRSALLSELSTTSSAQLIVRRVAALLMLAPTLSIGLSIAAEALLDIVGQYSLTIVISQIAIGLCRQWPTMEKHFVNAVREFWRDLKYGTATISFSRGPIASLCAHLVAARVIKAAHVVSPLRLEPGATSSTQAGFACMVLRRMQGVLGLEAIRADLFTQESSDDYDEGGIFPYSGHPDNVRFARELFEAEGLDWLCAHESFSDLAVLSDSDE